MSVFIVIFLQVCLFFHDVDYGMDSSLALSFSVCLCSRGLEIRLFILFFSSSLVRRLELYVLAIIHFIFSVVAYSVVLVFDLMTCLGFLVLLMVVR
jgi:hypothetical protein